MEKVINIHIEKLPEGVYLATSKEIQGLVAQGRTIAETLEAAGARVLPARPVAGGLEVDRPVIHS